ncbi:MAG: hypothetical protein UY16_C0065G0008 [Candidatus Gottesmanbacteria bacterium GW2011_GWA2_47_9]|uniref:Protein containing DUF497 n=1 Tax=Candidatus Gottesmanbacteria bacterium GW2011_GWA2_47_9 TaxID=1618445 RepID=A0A0G1WUU3_9BACT|nr:MAG: hypothetical protein UY16_C0065G0008 [Candidatus Gottesmanbacteria bacterium GW2011_GWA2_47_9]
MDVLPDPIEFDWDEGNIDKNFIKHGLTNKQIEAVFVSGHPQYMIDERHSLKERRYMLWNKSSDGRYVTVIFTIRSPKVRVISARVMNRRERSAYETKETI